MATPSHLNGPAFQASRAALSAALADTQSLAESPTKEDEIEQGEIQEVDMQAQAETIRTVFSDPTNFNVKVSMLAFLTSETLSMPFVFSIPSTRPGHCGSTLR